MQRFLVIACALVAGCKDKPAARSSDPAAAAPEKLPTEPATPPAPADPAPADPAPAAPLPTSYPNGVQEMITPPNCTLFGAADASKIVGTTMKQTSQPDEPVCELEAEDGLEIGYVVRAGSEYFETMKPMSTEISGLGDQAFYRTDTEEPEILVMVLKNNKALQIQMKVSEQAKSSREAWGRAIAQAIIAKL